MRVRVLEAAQLGASRAAAGPGEAEWRGFVAARPQAGFFHRLEWRDAVQEEYPRLRPFYLLAEDSGATRGILPLFLVDAPLSGRLLLSVPFAVYGGICADDAAAEAALLEAACGLAERSAVRHLELRNAGAPRGRLPTSSLYVTFVRDLPSDPDECLARIPRKSRATVRQARDRHGLEFVAGAELLGDFHRLFVLNKRALGSPVFSRVWFRRLLERYGDDVWMHGVRRDGRVLAAVMSFVHRGRLMPYYSGMEPGAERLGTMNFLYWALMREGVRRGLTSFDFGRSRAGTGAYDFKCNMGFEPAPLAYQYYLRGGAAIPTLNPSNPRFAAAKAAWSRLPVAVVNVLGPRLMPSFA